jgi:hypothetical protein
VIDGRKKFYNVDDQADAADSEGGHALYVVADELFDFRHFSLF